MSDKTKAHKNFNRNGEVRAEKTYPPFQIRILMI